MSGEEEQGEEGHAHWLWRDVLDLHQPGAQVKRLAYGCVCNRKKGEKRQPLEAFPGQFSGSSGNTVLQEINLLSISFQLCPW